MIFIILKKRKQTDFILIDTYSGYAFYYTFLCSLICRVLYKKYIPILRGGDLPDRIKNYRILSNSIFNNSFLNISPSSYLKKKFELYGYKVTIIPNFIDIENYPFLIREDCKPKIFWVRSFHSVYNPKMAILVLYELLKSFPNSVLCMVGPDKDGSLADCKEIATKLGIINKIKFTGLLRKKEWVQLSTQYDLFINTTDYDNTPVSVLEAMALGFPIITTNAGGLSFFHEDGVDALMVEKNDINGMVKKILFLLSEKKYAQKLSKNSRKKAEKFGWKIIKKSWIKIFSTKK